MIFRNIQQSGFLNFKYFYYYLEYNVKIIECQENKKKNWILKQVQDDRERQAQIAGDVRTFLRIKS